MGADERPVVIVGAGRQGRNALDVCLDLGRPVLGFLDDTKAAGAEVNGRPVLGAFARLDEPDAFEGSTCFVALGSSGARQAATARARTAGWTLATLVHPSSPVSASASLGTGVFVNACCRIRANARLEEGVLLESHASVGTDAVLGAFAGTGPGVHLTAGVVLGPGAFVGAGAVVTRGARVGAGAVVAAGATVLEHVAPGVLVVGTPAHVVGPAPADLYRQSPR